MQSLKRFWSELPFSQKVSVTCIAIALVTVVINVVLYINR